jgi:hypothetical protein
MENFIMEEELMDELEDIPVWGDGTTVHDVYDCVDFEWEE